jgi:hypothetical protein
VTDPGPFTVNAEETRLSGIETLAVCVPEVPVTVKLLLPNTAEALAFNVSEANPVVGLGEKDAVTPLGRPATARLTLPVNPYWGFTATFVVAEVPGAIATGPLPLNVKVGANTPNAILVVAFTEPDVPVIVTALVPVAAVLLAVSVSVLYPTVGFGVREPVTPLGRPAIERLTAPVNPYIGFR